MSSFLSLHWIDHNKICRQQTHYYYRMDHTTLRFLSMWRTTSTTTTTKSPKPLEANHEEPMRNCNSNRNDNINNRDLSYWNRWMTFKNRLLTSKPGSLLSSSSSTTTTTATTGASITATSLDWREAQELITVLRRTNSSAYTTIDTKTEPTTSTTTGTRSSSSSSSLSWQLERLESMFQVLDRMCLEVEYVNGTMQQQPKQQQQQPTTTRGSTQKTLTFCLDGGILGATLVSWRDFVLSSSLLSSSDMITHYMRTTTLTAATTTTTTTTATTTSIGLDPISIWNRLERYHHAGLFLVRPPAYAILLHVMSKILQQKQQQQHIHNDNNNNSNNNSSSSLSLSALSQQQQKQQQEPQQQEPQQQQQYELLEDIYLYHAQLIHQTLLLRSNYNPHDKIHHPTSATIYGLMQVWANCSRKNHYHHHHPQQEQDQQEQYQQQQYQQQAPYQVEQLLRTLQQWYQQTKRQDQQPTANLFCTVMEVFVKNHSTKNIINQYDYSDKNHYDNKNEKHSIRNVGFDDDNNNGLGADGTLLFGGDGLGTTTTTTNHTNPTTAATTTTTTASSETIFHHIATLYKEMQQTCPDWTCGLINARVCHVLATCCNNNNHTTTNTTNTVAKMAANWAHTLYVQQCHRYQDNQYNTYYKPNPHTLSSVLIAHGRTGQVQQATELFHFMDQWSEVVEQQEEEEEEWYNNNNEKQQEPTTTTRIQQQYEQQQQQQPPTKTKRQEEEEQKRRYASQCRRALKPNFICCSTLLWVYAKVGDTQRAEDMLHRMIHDLEQDSGGGSSSSGYDDDNDNNHHNHDTKALLWDAQMWHGVLTAWATSGNPKAPEYMTQIIERLRLLQSQEQQQQQQEEEMNGPYNIVNVTMYNKLLGCYANQHKVEKAEELFHWMECCYQSNKNNCNNNDNTTKQVLVAAPNAESYLAMILAWSKVGNPERCEWYLRKYCNSILRFPQQQQQQQPHDDYYDDNDKVNHDHHHNIGIHNNHHNHQKHFGVVMDTWAKSKHPQAVVKAQAIFDWMKQELQIQPSAVIYTSLMWAWVYSDMKQMGDPAPHVIRLLEEMKYNYHLKMKQGDWIGAIAIQPTDHIYNAVLSALSKSKNQPQSLNQAIHLFREMAIRNSSSSSSDHNNNNQHHHHYPHDIPSPNVQHYTTIMNACSKHNRPDLAEQFFQELKCNIEQENNNNNRNHREQNHFVHGVVAMTGDLSAVYRTRVEAWAQAGDPEMTRQALEEWIADYYYHDDDNSSVVSSSFTSSSFSSCVNGRRIRLQDPPRLQDWSAILRAWLRSNRPDAAERADDVLRQQFQHLLLPPSPLRPDHDDDDDQQQQQQQQQQERISLPPTKGIVVVDDSHCLNTRSFDTVISAYAKSNSPQAGENALRLFRDLKRLKAATTTAASSSSSSSTTGSNADMEQENHLEPTLVTYSGVIVALSRSSCCCGSYQQDSKLHNPKQYSHEIQVLLNELKTKNIKFWSLVRTPERLLAMMKRTIDSTSSLLPNKHALQMTLSNLDSILATTTRTRTTTNSNRTITHHHAKKKQDGQRQPSFSR